VLPIEITNRRGGGGGGEGEGTKSYDGEKALSSISINYSLAVKEDQVGRK
jgi:hypothetical protein